MVASYGIGNSGQTIDRRPTDELMGYFRCPRDAAQLPFNGNAEAASLLAEDDTTYVRRIVGVFPLDRASVSLPNVSAAVRLGRRSSGSSFDPGAVCRALRCESYVGPRQRSSTGQGAVRRAYYAVRPLMPVAVRKHLQRLALRDWDRIRFPQWPVDLSVDSLMWRQLALASLVAGEPVPFIWFWPDGYQACCIITHDVETSAGRDFCGHLMQVTESRGFRSSFQVIPEDRYVVPADYLAEIRERKFEVNVHGLNHDGHLFDSHDEFTRRIRRIRDYATEWEARGFRSPVLYRNSRWMNELPFEYDMSFPNVAHLDPQRGGCCTVMPYFFGNVVELPLSMTQDYSLFNILNDYSLAVWTQQVDLVTSHHGLISVNIHPDYIMEQRAQRTYQNLLDLLANRCEVDRVWATLPGEVARWWRERSRMRLVQDGQTWRIEGAGRDRARLAYADFDGRELVVRLAHRSL